MTDDFLSRWSRRKLEVRRAETAPVAAPLDPAPGLPVAEEAPAAGEGTPAPAAPEAAEAALPLPSIDELTPDSDLSAFLAKSVPEALRNAALRRMWSLDPAVRDFIGDARDYAYDWNTPGGVPGFGPIEATDDAYAMLKTMFSDGSAPADEEPAATDGSEPSEVADLESPSCPEAEASDSEEERSRPAPEEAGTPDQAAGSVDDTTAAPAAPPAVPVRRQGSATPA